MIARTCFLVFRNEYFPSDSADQYIAVVYYYINVEVTGLQVQHSTFAVVVSCGDMECHLAGVDNIRGQQRSIDMPHSKH